MFLSTEGILLVSFPSKSYHFFCKCWELSKSTTFPFPKLSDKSELFTKHLCSFIRKKNQRFHIRLFSQISFAVEPFMPFLVIQKRQSLRTVITLVAIKPYETMRVLLMALYTHFLTIYYSASVTTLINSIMHFTEMFISCVSKLESVLDSESVEARTTKLDGLHSEPLY